LDLNNPATFRNLSKPMGAQTDDRLTQYKKRFKDWEDPNGKNLPPASQDWEEPYSKPFTNPDWEELNDMPLPHGDLGPDSQKYI